MISLQIQEKNAPVCNKNLKLLIRKVRSGCVKSLKNLSVAMNKSDCFSLSVKFERLHFLEIFTADIRIALKATAEAVESGSFPALKNLTLTILDPEGSTEFISYLIKASEELRRRMTGILPNSFIESVICAMPGLVAYQVNDWDMELQLLTRKPENPSELLKVTEEQIESMARTVTISFIENTRHQLTTQQNAFLTRTVYEYLIDTMTMVRNANPNTEYVEMGTVELLQDTRRRLTDHGIKITILNLLTLYQDKW